MSGMSTPSRKLSRTTTRVAPPSRRNAFSCNSAQMREVELTSLTRQPVAPPISLRSDTGHSRDQSDSDRTVSPIKRMVFMQHRHLLSAALDFGVAWTWQEGGNV